jgi:hypothetical protein
MGTVPIACNVADRVMNPPPVTAAAPFETQHQDQQQESLLPASQCVLVACATKIAAIVR